MNGEVEVVEPHPEEACPIGPVVEIVFSRWTTPILWTLHACGRQRFGELERQIMSVTPKVLTDTLRKLERDGLVVRTTHPGCPRASSTRSANWDRASRVSSRCSPTGRGTTWRRSGRLGCTTRSASPPACAADRRSATRGEPAPGRRGQAPAPGRDRGDGGLRHRSGCQTR